jgi:hypothetical protein
MLWLQSAVQGEIMYKIEIDMGWLADTKLTIETHDFDIIEVIKEFVEFQESEGWAGAWNPIVFDDSEIDEDDAEDDAEEVK